MENLLIAQSFALLKEDKRRVEEVLESLGIAHKKNAYPNELSYGQLQRVSIARAVINKPTLVIADEPTSSLDDRNAEAVITLLAEQSRINGSTLVVSTHDQRVKDSFDKKYIL
jgi:putative ABC transport system ATP-binding protein